MATLGLFRNKKNSKEAIAVGKILARLRKDSKLSVREVSTITGIDRTSITRHEKGQADAMAPVYYKYACAYNVSYTWLLWKLLTKIRKLETEEVLSNGGTSNCT